MKKALIITSLFISILGFSAYNAVDERVAESVTPQHNVQEVARVIDPVPQVVQNEEVESEITNKEVAEVTKRNISTKNTTDDTAIAEAVDETVNGVTESIVEEPQTVTEDPEVKNITWRYSSTADGEYGCDVEYSDESKQFVSSANNENVNELCTGLWGKTKSQVQSLAN